VRVCFVFKTRLPAFPLPFRSTGNAPAFEITFDPCHGAGKAGQSVAGYGAPKKCLHGMA
jgi:hypothetical protein